MQIIYKGRKGGWGKEPVPVLEGDRIELLSNNWDDYGHETFFATTCRIKDQDIELGSIRLLIEGEKNSSTYLNKLRDDGWDGIFPIPKTNYLSVPSEISFYEQILSLLKVQTTKKVAKQLRDASYLVNVEDDEAAQNLIGSDGFTTSLLRERGSIKSFTDGWKIFSNGQMEVSSFSFRFSDFANKTQDINFKFGAESNLPHDINVLIGPNGIGKSQLLHQMVKAWISTAKVKNKAFSPKPNLSQLIVVSYSPFEKFPVDVSKKDLQDKSMYRYFGFRGRRTASETHSSGAIILSQTVPKRNASFALLECLENDQRFKSVHEWGHKLKTLQKVVLSAFEFDVATLCIETPNELGDVSSDKFELSPEIEKLSESADDGNTYIPISEKHADFLNAEFIRNSLVSEKGITFFKDGHPIKLSSGQKLFAYVVIDILGAIRKNSLLLVDEPELFLHPTLEIQFIEMLKEVLRKFSSKAVLATHSVVTVREVPEDCVHVFQKNELEELIIKRPPFQTFGGDFQRISSYVFGDNSVSKPFESWIKEKLEEYGSSESLLENLRGQLNEELTIQIMAMGDK